MLNSCGLDLGPTDDFVLLGCYTLGRYDDDDKEYREDDEAFRCASLSKSYISSGFHIAGDGAPYYYAVIPGKDGQLVQACDKIPTSGDVSGDKDAQRNTGE